MSVTGKLWLPLVQTATDSCLLHLLENDRYRARQVQLASFAITTRIDLHKAFLPRNLVCWAESSLAIG